MGNTPAGHATGEDRAVITGSAACDAGEKLFQSMYPQLAGWVRCLVEDDDTAHEIASEAFVRLLSRWTRVDNPHDYLWMIAGNLIRDRPGPRRRRWLRTQDLIQRLPDQLRPSVARTAAQLSGLPGCQDASVDGKGAGCGGWCAVRKAARWRVS